MKLPLGAHIRDVGNTERTKTGKWKTFKPVVDNEKCIDCGNCWIFCPDICVYKEKGEYVVDLEFCKGCGICANECPVKAITMVLEEK